MPTALIVTADLGGNVPPLLGVATELLRRGWTVIVHGDERLRHRVTGAGLRFSLAEGQAYDPLQPRSTPRALRDFSRFATDRSRGRSAVAIAERESADVVAVDALLMGAAAQIEEEGLPTVVLAHSCWDYFAGPFRSGPIAAALRLRGVSPTRVFNRADRIVVLSDARLGGSKPLAGNARLTGPVLQEVPERGDREDPALVLVSLSTIWYPGMTEALQRVLDALAPMRVRVEVTTGRTIRPDDLRVPADATVQEFADHGRILPAASLVVGHGGHATTVRALAHGVPVLVLPMHPLLDQPMIGKAVAATGAGLSLRKSARPEVIRAAARRLLEEPGFRASAEAIAADLRLGDGARAAADVLAEVATQSRPVRLQASSDSAPGPLSSS